MTQRYIISGGSDGPGRDFGTLCIDHNIDVICLDDKKPDYPCTYIQTNLTCTQSLDHAVSIIQNQHPPFDALINCGDLSRSVHDVEALWLSYNEACSFYSKYLATTFYLTLSLFDDIQQNGADILMVSPKASIKPALEHLCYNSAKTHIADFTQNIQTALKDTKSRVIDYHPDSDKAKIYTTPEDYERDITVFSTPHEIAKTMFALLQAPRSK